jgi:hypothetical protein
MTTLTTRASFHVSDETRTFRLRLPAGNYHNTATTSSSSRRARGMPVLSASFEQQQYEQRAQLRYYNNRDRCPDCSTNIDFAFF